MIAACLALQAAGCEAPTDDGATASSPHRDPATNASVRPAANRDAARPAPGAPVTAAADDSRRAPSQRLDAGAPPPTGERAPSFELAPSGLTSCAELTPDDPSLDRLRHMDRATPAEIDRALRQVHCQYPSRTAIAEIGTSHQGRPIVGLWIGDGVRLDHRRPSFLLNGSHHGDELISTDFVLDAIATLVEARGPSTRRWLAQVVVVAVPLLNPDGRAITLRLNRSGRKNGRDTDGDGERSAFEGVDLNRNYPFRWGAQGDRASKGDPHHKWYRGPFAGSEPETRAIMRLSIAEHFVASVSFHSGAVALLAPYTIADVRDPAPPIARRIAREAHRAMPRHPQGPVEFKRNLYPVDGTDQDWHYARHGTVALLLEGAHKSALGPWDRQRTFVYSRSLWGYLVDRYLDGPSIHGRVADERGRPVVATVSIEEVSTREGERWRSRCRDGAFHRYLMEPGSYTVVVEAPGMPQLTRRVDVGRSSTRVDFAFDSEMSSGPACAPPVAHGRGAGP